MAPVVRFMPRIPLPRFFTWLPRLTLGLCVTLSAHAQLPSPAEVRAAYRSSETLILDRHGETLQRMRSDANVRRGPWVSLADVSPALRHALILSEDQQFYAHSGVDWRAVSSAAWANLWNTRTRGASTLTMQLAGLLDDDLQASQGRSVGQKINQAWMARQLEKSWRKDQILETYLNRVPFRGDLVGIDALVQSMFAKHPSGLDARESAIAVALIRGPNASPARVAQRACQIVQATTPGRSDTDCEAMTMLSTAALRRQAFASSEGLAPHLAQRMLQTAQTGGKRAPPTLRSTLDAPMQAMAIASLKRHLQEIRSRNVEDGAVVILDNRSGDVLAWVGSSGSMSQARHVDGVTARRQPGSTLKPLLYAQAIEAQRLTAGSLLEDAPTQVVTPTGLYAPQNYDNHYQGWVSVRSALGASLNIPAVRTLAMVGPDSFAERLNALGLRLAQSGGHHGLSLALGSAEVTLLDLTNAYRALANGGVYSAARWVREAQVPAPAAVRVFDAGAAFIVGDVLSDPMARAAAFGTASVLATRSWSAVKTGTSKDMRDNWAVGWSDRYTVGVWVGNASGEAMWSVSGVSGAAPVWADLMGQLHQTQASRAPQAPQQVIAAPIQYGPSSVHANAPPIEPPRREWFLAGTEQTQFTVPADLLAAGSAAAAVKPSSRAGMRGAATHARASPSNAAAAHSTRSIGQASAGATVTPPAWWSAMAGGSKGDQATRITAPTSGTIVALDPDIPPANQRLVFSSDATGHAGAALRWQINGKDIGRGATARWLPWPGRYTVKLVNAQGRALDETRIEVRGAGMVGEYSAPPQKK